MYHQPFKEAKIMQNAAGNKNLEGVLFKGTKWYARARIKDRHIIELSFETEKEAYACRIGIVRCRESIEEKELMSINEYQRLLKAL